MAGPLRGLTRSTRQGRRRSPVALLAVAVLVAAVCHAAQEAFVPAPGHGRESPQAATQPSRRQLLYTAGSSLLATCFGPSPSQAEQQQWRSLPQASAVPSQYPVRFTTYLTRFLLNFDSNFFFYYKASGSTWPLNQLESTEFEKDEVFAKFARTTEIALLNYPPENGGTAKLFKALLDNYGGGFEARRQLCILFALLKGDQQPVEPVRQLLRTVENSSVASVSLTEPGEFVSEPWKGTEAPQATLELSRPSAEDGRPATITCRLRALDENSTRWVVDNVKLEDEGSGYSCDVDLSPRLVLPRALRAVSEPSFKVKLDRPEPVDRDERRAVPGLKRKFTALLPSSLLPYYDTRQGVLVPDQSIPLPSDPNRKEESRRLDEVFGEGRQLDRFRADFVFAEFDSTYGPVGLSPFERERQLTPSDFFLLALSGGLAGLLKELVFMPIKNVKYRLQVDADLGSGGGMTGAFREIVTTEPWYSLYRGVDAAAAVALFFSILSFGTTEYVKRAAAAAFPQLGEVASLILGSAAGVFLAMVFVTPFDVLSARVSSVRRSQANSGEVPYWGLSLLGNMIRANGVAALPELYGDYWILVGRELAFVVTKFVVFDSLREAALFFVPAFAEDQSLLVACACGAVAGAISTVVSHPLDTLFALWTTGDAEGSGSDGQLPSLSVLYRGVGARILLFSPGIALIFLLYDYIKTALGVGGNALVETLDLLEPLQT